MAIGMSVPMHLTTQVIGSLLKGGHERVFYSELNSSCEGKGKRSKTQFDFFNLEIVADAKILLLKPW